MNSSRTLYRKLAYLAGVAVLAFPLAWLGMPSSIKGNVEDAGGKLAQLRKDHRLGQSDLGAIDPASETIRLATLGLRGVAVTMLWNKANEYKKTEDWTGFEATLDQLARLQPYFVKVWQYQAWNLSYNLSVELDNYRDRFYYVKQGIEYLEKGILYLRDNPVLLDDLGWFCGNKVGRADEHEFYRRLFRLDDELHQRTSRTPEERDNWLVSKEWYIKALQAVDSGKQSLGQKNPTTFFDSPARAQISYAEAIEEEGTFGDRARSAWKEGGRLWREYGQREMKSTEDFMIRMVDLEMWEQRVIELKQQLDALSPGLEKSMQEEALASLTPEQRAVTGSPPGELTAEQATAQQEAAEKLNIGTVKIAARIAKDEPAKASQAQGLAQRIDAAQKRVFHISSNRDVANYKYWSIRCDLEQTQEALQARALAHSAKIAFQEKGDPKAKDDYEKSFDLWAAALAKFPELPADSSTGSDLLDVVGEYVKLLEQQDLSLEDPEVADRFPLWHIVRANDQMNKFESAIKAYDARVTGVPAEGKTLINPADALLD